ncbi:FAD-binding oxidoreductase [Acuticoccus sp. M5D2P5]|uniref:NAD(P)/FAD-dependent oxidoreductase n=1 Tax=Acuticoccus kalidii TaxID=2910977 RepID=UPI001F1E106B|nr:FAD-binding oxidoreductase [Acuticoccus kalidii]MCF3934799.1 FAD-binding oxidoreductase [Acuticoccus kalidii]
MSHIVVLGAGIVGLATAEALLADGHAVTIVDREAAIPGASKGNAGGLGVTEIMPLDFAATLWKLPRWLADPLGPVSVGAAQAVKMLPWMRAMARTASPTRRAAAIAALASALAEAPRDFVALLDTLGLREELNEVGALWCYETKAAFEADAADRKARRAHGIVMEEIGGDEARAMEPALGPRTAAAVFTPQWSHVNDPATLVNALRRHLETAGVGFVAGEVVGVDGAALKLTCGRTLPFERLVVAAGAWSGALARAVGDQVLLESERGYNTTIPEPGVSLSREIIFAERHFVATPMQCGLRIGGAAEFRGLRAPPNYRRSAALASLAKLYLPDLDSTGGQDWMGHRPATPDSLPVIGVSPRRADVFYAFGHGHVGLTLGPTTGRMIADLVADRPPHVDPAPFSISRFA